MIFLALDTEQAAMVVIAAEAANALLRARLHRVDPDGVISNSSILQEHKIEQIRVQMDQGSLSTWPQLDEQDRNQFLKLVFAFAEAPDHKEREAVYDAMMVFVTSHRTTQKQLPGAQNDRAR